LVVDVTGQAMKTKTREDKDDQGDYESDEDEDFTEVSHNWMKRREIASDEGHGDVVNIV
jgi:hypothetical protein